MEVSGDEEIGPETDTGLDESEQVLSRIAQLDVVLNLYRVVDIPLAG